MGSSQCSLQTGTFYHTIPLTPNIWPNQHLPELKLKVSISSLFVAVELELYPIQEEGQTFLNGGMT